jgi:hypothetical protein
VTIAWPRHAGCLNHRHHRRDKGNDLAVFVNVFLSWIVASPVHWPLKNDVKCET